MKFLFLFVLAFLCIPSAANDCIAKGLTWETPESRAIGHAGKRGPFTVTGMYCPSQNRGIAILTVNPALAAGLQKTCGFFDEEAYVIDCPNLTCDIDWKFSYSIDMCTVMAMMTAGPVMQMMEKYLGGYAALMGTDAIGKLGSQTIKGAMDLVEYYKTTRLGGWVETGTKWYAKRKVKQKIAAMCKDAGELIKGVEQVVSCVVQKKVELPGLMKDGLTKMSDVIAQMGRKAGGIRFRLEAKASFVFNQWRIGESKVDKFIFGIDIDIPTNTAGLGAWTYVARSALTIVGVKTGYGDGCTKDFQKVAESVRVNIDLWHLRTMYPTMKIFCKAYGGWWQNTLTKAANTFINQAGSVWSKIKGWYDSVIGRRALVNSMDVEEHIAEYVAFHDEEMVSEVQLGMETDFLRAVIQMAEAQQEMEAEDYVAAVTDRKHRRYEEALALLVEKLGINPEDF